MAGVAATSPIRLNASELAVLAYLADGLTRSSAARRLGISVRTLRRRVRAVCARLGGCEPIEAVVWAATFRRSDGWAHLL